MVFTKITIMEEGLLIYVTSKDVFRTQKNLKKIVCKDDLISYAKQTFEQLV